MVGSKVYKNGRDNRQDASLLTPYSIFKQQCFHENHAGQLAVTGYYSYEADRLVYTT